MPSRSHWKLRRAHGTADVTDDGEPTRYIRAINTELTPLQKNLLTVVGMFGVFAFGWLLAKIILHVSTHSVTDGHGEPSKWVWGSAIGGVALSLACVAPPFAIRLFSLLMSLLPWGRK